MNCQIPGTDIRTGCAFTNHRYVTEGDTVYSEFYTRWYISEGGKESESEHVLWRFRHDEKTAELRRAKRLKREAAEKAKRDAEARTDAEVAKRAKLLLSQQDKGGCICTISRVFSSTFTSVWEYRCTADNLLIRRRTTDDAMACFHNVSDLLEDFNRYRHAGFELV